MNYKERCVMTTVEGERGLLSAAVVQNTQRAGFLGSPTTHHPPRPDRHAPEDEDEETPPTPPTHQPTNQPLW